MTIILNYKTYPESLGENAIKLAEAAYNVSLKNNHKIIVCPQFVDIENVVSHFPQNDNFEIWAQHMDYQEGGKETGFVTADTLKAIGVKGSLLNHSEHNVSDLGKYIGIDKRFDLCVCTGDVLELSLAFAKNRDFSPKYIAYEPAELIGADVSVATSHSHDIQRIVEKFHGYEILVGAGVRNNNDVKLSLEYGARGVILSSGFVMAQEKQEFLERLIDQG
jgi:triosephosphate isomerase